MIAALLLQAALAFASPQAAAAEFVVPALAGAVVDEANILSTETESLLGRALTEHWRAGGTQIAVLTVPDLQGVSLEEASLKVVEKWKLGTAKADNGVLLFVAKAERSARIEVGQGVEGVLPDAYARRIIDDVLVPHFKKGEYDEGIISAAVAITQRTDPNMPLAIGTPPPSNVDTSNDDGRYSWGQLLLFLVILIFVFASSRRRRSSFWWGGGGGFGGGGFGGGGGGFSGGGGGFSGGGASGKW